MNISKINNIFVSSISLGGLVLTSSTQILGSHNNINRINARPVLQIAFLMRFFYCVSWASPHKIVYKSGSRQVDADMGATKRCGATSSPQLIRYTVTEPTDVRNWLNLHLSLYTSLFLGKGDYRGKGEETSLHSLNQFSPSGSQFYLNNSTS